MYVCMYVHIAYALYVLPLIFKTILNIWVTLIYSVDSDDDGDVHDNNNNNGGDDNNYATTTLYLL